jgi:outer membrane protein OmpA-like peptidoglycan-associated protein
VRDYLVANGVAAARLTPRGYGAQSPVADNATAEGRQRNRRIVFEPQ